MKPQEITIRIIVEGPGTQPAAPADGFVAVEPKNTKAVSPSQDLRFAIYGVWERAGQPGEFEDFYKSQMTRIISIIKKK